MSCAEIEQELVGYHFNTLPQDVRRRVEAHLPECDACVRAFVELKRDIETGEEAPRPSEAARLRLRRAVARELGVEAPRWRWWERPAAIAFAASVVLAAGMTTRLLTSRPGAPPHAITDR